MSLNESIDEDVLKEKVDVAECGFCES